MTKMLNEALQFLDAHAKDMDISWGWSQSDVPYAPPWVLCVDLSTGLREFKEKYE